MATKATKPSSKGKTARKKTLIIVESPSKGQDHRQSIWVRLIKSWRPVGHVRDLPKSKLGINIENDFEPEYIAIRGKGDLIKELKKEAKQASEDISGYRPGPGRRSYIMAPGLSAGDRSCVRLPYSI